MKNSNIKISLSFHPLFFPPAPANGPAGGRVISVAGTAEMGLTLVSQKKEAQDWRPEDSEPLDSGRVVALALLSCRHSLSKEPRTWLSLIP